MQCEKLFKHQEECAHALEALSSNFAQEIEKLLNEYEVLEALISNFAQEIEKLLNESEDLARTDRLITIEKPLNKNKQHKSTGTTILAIPCNDGVMLGWDYRTTAGEFITCDSPKDKMFEITDNMVCLKAGVVHELDAMQTQVMEKVRKRRIQQKPISVLKIASIVFNTLVGQVGPSESIITGWNEIKGRFDIWSAIAHDPIKLELVQYAACGSGKSHALEVLHNRYYAGMTAVEAEELAIEALFDSIFLDPCSGGGIRVCYLQKDGHVFTYKSLDPLELYCDFFDTYRASSPVLFLIVPSSCEQYPVEYYRKFFWQTFHVEIVTCHIVALKRDFYFYRLVLDSEDDVSRIHQEVQPLPPFPTASFGRGAGEPLYISCFPMGFLFQGMRSHPIYVEKKSKETLKIIRGMA